MKYLLLSVKNSNFIKFYLSLRLDFAYHMTLHFADARFVLEFENITLLLFQCYMLFSLF